MTVTSIPNKPTSRANGTQRRPRGWTFFVPSLSVLLFALIITLPWGFGPETVYVPPLLIMALIVSWTVRHPSFVPSLLVFLVGISVDVVTASPVGYWAFLFLVAYACALHVARWEFEWLSVASLVALGPITILVGGLGWGLTSAYFAGFVEWEPVYDSVKIAWFTCPLIVLIVRWMSNWMMRLTIPTGNGRSAS